MTHSPCPCVRSVAHAHGARQAARRALAELILGILGARERPEASHRHAAPGLKARFFTASRTSGQSSPKRVRQKAQALLKGLPKKQGNAHER